MKTDASEYRVIKNEEKLPWSAYVGICGMAGASDMPAMTTQRSALTWIPGETACYAWKEYARAQKVRVSPSYSVK